MIVCLLSSPSNVIDTLRWKSRIHLHHPIIKQFTQQHSHYLRNCYLKNYSICYCVYFAQLSMQYSHEISDLDRKVQKVLYLTIYHPISIHHRDFACFGFYFFPISNYQVQVIQITYCHFHLQATHHHWFTVVIKHQIPGVRYPQLEF